MITIKDLIIGNGMLWEKSVDPEKTAPDRSSLIRVYTFCHFVIN